MKSPRAVPSAKVAKTDGPIEELPPLGGDAVDGQRPLSRYQTTKIAVSTTAHRRVVPA